MTLARLAVLQWLGLLVGALAWAAMHVVGFGITTAACGAGGSRWGIEHDVWQGALMGATALVVLGAEAASVAVLAGTRGTSYEDEPPASRIRFFAITAATANAVFLMIVLLDGFGSIFNVLCRGA